MKNKDNLGGGLWLLKFAQDHGGQVAVGCAVFVVVAIVSAVSFGIHLYFSR